MPQEKLENTNNSAVETPVEMPVSPENIQDGEITQETGEPSALEQIQHITDERGALDETIEKITLSSEQDSSRMDEIRQQLGMPPENEVPPSISEKNEKLQELQKQKDELEKKRNELLNEQEKTRRIEEEKKRILAEKVQRYRDTHPDNTQGQGGGNRANPSGGGESSEPMPVFPLGIPEETMSALEAEALEEAIKIVEREMSAKEKEIVDEEKKLEANTEGEQPIAPENVISEENVIDNDGAESVEPEIK
jgi:hypothetical protein